MGWADISEHSGAAQRDIGRRGIASGGVWAWHARAARRAVLLELCAGGGHCGLDAGAAVHGAGGGLLSGRRRSGVWRADRGSLVSHSAASI